MNIYVFTGITTWGKVGNKFAILFTMPRVKIETCCFESLEKGC